MGRHSRFDQERDQSLLIFIGAVITAGAVVLGSFVWLLERIFDLA